MISELVALLIPIFVCVVLPVAIVYIVFRASTNRENKRAEIIMKAIEANNDMDINNIVSSLQKPKKNARDVLYQRLLCGCVFTFTGIALLVFGIYANYSFPELNYQSIAFLVCAVCMAIGIGYLVTYFVTRKQIMGSTEGE